MHRQFTSVWSVSISVINFDWLYFRCYICYMCYTTSSFVLILWCKSFWLFNLLANTGGAWTRFLYPVREHKPVWSDHVGLEREPICDPPACTSSKIIQPSLPVLSGRARLISFFWPSQKSPGEVCPYTVASMWFVSYCSIFLRPFEHHTIWPAMFLCIVNFGIKSEFSIFGFLKTKLVKMP